jgi:hypothetical protein
MLRIIFNLGVLVVFVSLVSSLVGCTSVDPTPCVPMHIGVGYDDDGMLRTIQVEEMGCSRIDNYKNF